MSMKVDFVAAGAMTALLAMTASTPPAIAQVGVDIDVTAIARN
jgi:hypothetical protein